MQTGIYNIFRNNLRTSDKSVLVLELFLYVVAVVKRRKTGILLLFLDSAPQGLDAGLKNLEITALHFLVKCRCTINEKHCFVPQIEKNLFTNYILVIQKSIEKILFIDGM